MSKVLLVTPPGSKAKEAYQTGSKFPRIGIAYIAGYLRSKGIDVKIVDSKVLQLTLDDVAKAISEYRPDIVGLGPFTEEIIEAYNVCRISKSIDHRIMTVLGGPHASALPVRTLQECPEVDLVVLGEGEETLWRIHVRSELQNIKGIAYRDKNQVNVNDSPELIADIDFLPYPAWDLFPLDKYKGIMARKLGEETNRPVLQLPISSARGCPYRCIFCYKTIAGLRTRAAEKIVDEIEYNMRTYESTDFFFADGTFAADRKQGIAICDEIIKRRLNGKIIWEVETRVDIMTKEMADKLKMAGCTQVYLGVESGDSEILHGLNKGITLDMARCAVGLAKEAGLKTFCTFIIGHPNETKQTILSTYRFARELDPDIISVGIMIPYPGTRVCEMAIKGESGYRLISDDWSDYQKQKGGPLEMRDITLRELRRIHDVEYLRFFLRPKKFWFLIRNIPAKKIFKISKQIIFK